MYRLLTLVLLVALAFACSDGALDRARAVELISDLESFKREARFIIQTGVPYQTAFKCLTPAEVERAPLATFAITRGWVRLESREAVLGFGAKQSCPSLALTAAGEAASAKWQRNRAGTGDGVAWSIPIARREVANITDLTTAPDGPAQVVFDWRWSPNDIGTALRGSVPPAEGFFSEIRKGRASCRRVTDEWRCQLAMWTRPADAGDFQP